MNATCDTIRSRASVPAGGLVLLAFLALAAFPARRALADDPVKPPAVPPAAPPGPAKPAAPEKPAVPASPPLAGRFFDTYDANQDGKVSREEFTGDPETFALFDTNHDGLITLEEMGVPADYKPQPLKQPKDEPMGRGKEGGFRERAERLTKQFDEWDADK